jgi:hypothetical protein
MKHSFICYQLQSARFPVHRNQAGFDFEAAKIGGMLIELLAGTRFTDAAHNNSVDWWCRYWKNPSGNRPGR